MSERRYCAQDGGCSDSVANGGKGCHLCDVVPTMPKPVRRAKDVFDPEDDTKKPARKK